ncbi:hypothetical protein NL108_007529, partial [Boleophthalmus pectinirostris]
CLHCEKSFLNATFLQNHMQRRHPEEYDAKLLSDGERKSEIDSLKSEITALKEEIVQQQLTLQAKIAQQESLHRDLTRELDRFKAEEMARMDKKIEGCRDGIRREMEFLYTRNIQALNEANQQLSTKPGKSSPVQMEPEKDLDNYKEMQKQAIHKLEQQLKKQDKKFESRWQDMKDQHEAEKNQLLNELNRMQIVVSEQQEHSQKLKQEWGRKLLEKEQIIKNQKEQVSPHSQYHTAIYADRKHTTGSGLEPPSALMLDPIQELSEEDRESSSVSEAKPVERKPEPAPEKKKRTAISALRRNPNLRREMRPELEKSVITKLESYGVKPNRTGLKTKEMESILVKVHAERERKLKEQPDYWSYWQEISDTVDNKLGCPKKSHDHRNKQPMQACVCVVLQIYPRSNSLPSKATNVMSVSSERLSKTPQPAPRSKSVSLPKTSTPKDKTPTSPFSSDEESEEEETDAEEELQLDQRKKSSVVQNRTTPVLTKQASVTSVSSLPTRGLTTEVTKTTVMKIDSEDEETWSEVSELQEIDPKGLQSFKDQNGNVERKSFGKENKISEMGKKIEKQFTDRLGKKPAGGISIFPERKDEVQELSCTDLEESNEWVSSLEERVSKPVHGSVPLRKSLDSASTSVWGTSTGKGPKS